MKYVDEFRDAALVRNLIRSISAEARSPWNIMEICGGQTHSIMRYGLQELLPEGIHLFHGPGCPVCVTPVGLIDKALNLAHKPEVILLSFGDMLRVPGTESDLLKARSEGADVRAVFSPLDAIQIAKDNPLRKVVFFAVGFETTAPVIALTVLQAKRNKLKNFFILASHVLVPPAVKAILDDPQNRIQGFLAAGHVCTVMGFDEYLPVTENYRIPIVVTGFEPVDILTGILELVRLLEKNEAGLVNAYKRSVREDGNPAARKTLFEVFRVSDQVWRGIGTIADSGLCLREEYREFDAEAAFDLSLIEGKESPDCIAGAILTGQKKPTACKAFGTLCNPEKPLGAPMVSSEGVCAAYYRYSVSA